MFPGRPGTASSDRRHRQAWQSNQRRPGQSRHGRLASMSGRRFWPRFARHASWTVRLPRSPPRCSTRAPTFARNARCTASWLPMPPCESGATSFATPSTQSPNSWRQRPTRSGRGTSPSCAGRRSGTTSTSTSSSTSSAVTSSAGWSQSARRPLLAAGSSKRAVPSTASPLTRSSCTRTAARR